MSKQYALGPSLKIVHTLEKEREEGDHLIKRENLLFFLLLS